MNPGIHTDIPNIKLCEADTQEWLNLREGGIGASESAAACGVSEWSTPLEVYHRKRGELPAVAENRAMRIGKRMEPIIADEFEAETHLRIEQLNPGLFAYAESPWILASPDGVIDADQLLEIKTINDRRASEVLGEVGTDEIPFEWNVQAQQQMLVMGAKLVWFGVLVGGADFRIYQVPRHEVAIERIAAKVTDLWTRIKTGDPPPMQEGHRSNYQMARALFGEVEEGEIVDLETGIFEEWMCYEEKTKRGNELKKEAENHKAAVMLALGNAQAGTLPDGRFVRRKLIERKGYEVAACEYIDVKAVKKL